MNSVTRTAIVLIAILVLLGAGIFLSVRNTPKRTESPEASRRMTGAHPLQEPEATGDAEVDPPGSTETKGEEPDGPTGENQRTTDMQTQPEPADLQQDTEQDSSHEPATDKATQMDEETFIDLSVEIVITAMAMENSDTPQKELQNYVLQRLREEGYSAGAFKDATDRILADPEHAKEVSRTIVQRVKKQTDVQMDMRVLPMLDPRWEKAGPPGWMDKTGEPAQESE